MRLALIIALLTAIAVGLVHVRRAEIGARHEAQRLQLRQVRLRRQLWAQQGRLGRLTAPRRVRQRVRDMGLEMAEGARPAARPSAERTDRGG